VVEDLLTPGHGMALALRSADRGEVGKSPRKVSELVIALVRHGRVMSLASPDCAMIETGDLLVYIRDDAQVPVDTAPARDA
jgi:voltage-gated potassium channel